MSQTNEKEHGVSHSSTNGMRLKCKLTETTWFSFDTEIHEWLNRYGEAGKEIRTKVPFNLTPPPENYKKTKQGTKPPGTVTPYIDKELLSIYHEKDREYRAIKNK
jgi:hypothetical protein